MAQALQCFVVDASAMASIVMFISIPLLAGEIRAESGATDATTDAAAKPSANNMRGQAMHHYKKSTTLGQLYKRNTVSQIHVSAQALGWQHQMMPNSAAS